VLDITLSVVHLMLQVLLTETNQGLNMVQKSKNKLLNSLSVCNLKTLKTEFIYIFYTFSVLSA